jgi:TRAP-type C4-dicarboxylate transport system substrate-binding protein
LSSFHFLSKDSVEILAPGVYSPMMLLTHKGVRTVADFQGQKVRTQGGAPIQVEPFKKLGVLPVSLPLGEALPAMQNRTIDGMIAGVAPFTAFKLCVPKIRFCNIGDEGRRGQAVMR